MPAKPPSQHSLKKPTSTGGSNRVQPSSSSSTMGPQRLAPTSSYSAYQGEKAGGSVPLPATPPVASTRMMDLMGSSSSNQQMLDKEELNRLVEAHMRSGEYSTATFWMEKMLAMDAHLPVRKRLPELAAYLKVLTAAGSWQMVITFVSRHDLLLVHLVFAYFYVNALYQRELYGEIVSLPLGCLGRWDDVPFIDADPATNIYMDLNSAKDAEVERRLDQIAASDNCESRLLLLLTRTYLIVQNRPAASGCLKHCLMLNPYSSEAIHLAVESRLLRPADIQAIIQQPANGSWDRAGPSSSTSKPEPIAEKNASGLLVTKHLLDVYNLYNEGAENTVVAPLPPRLAETFSADPSFQSANAFRLYYKGQVEEAYRLTSEIVHNLGYYERCFLVHIACLVELDRVSELYALGHQLVKMQPDSEVTWYTVGCYYYATGQFATGRKFLEKCTAISPGFGEGWVAYGHCLFYAEEHEQAMNSYLRASRILDGHYEPLLYIAVEYCFANNFKLAWDFLQNAESIAACENPVVLHEQGTVAFMRKEFAKAELIYRKALSVIAGVADEEGPDGLKLLLSCEIPDFWEPLFNNLGHTLRRLGRFAEAVEVHRKSLLLTTKNKADAWGAMGLCYASVCDIDNAVEAFNAAMVLKPGDDVLKCALDKVLAHASFSTPLPPSISGENEENFELPLNFDSSSPARKRIEGLTMDAAKRAETKRLKECHFYDAAIDDS